MVGTVYRPIKSDRFSQGFGEAKTCINQTTRKVVAKTPPTDVGVCPVGYVDLYKVALRMDGHSGEDWGAVRAEPVVFPVDIPVMEWIAQNHIDKDGGVGVDVFSLHPVPGLGYIKFRFWHLLKSSVYDGQIVKFGDVIGLGDSTGLSTKDHVHWSLKQTSETTRIKFGELFRTKFGVTLNNTNGYYGALNFRLYFDFVNVWANDVVKQRIAEAKADFPVENKEVIAELEKQVVVLTLRVKIATLMKQLAELLKGRKK